MTFSRAHTIPLLAVAAILQSCGAEVAEPSGCTSSQNEDGSVTIQCGDDDPITIVAPEPGADGVDGADGSSCTVVDNNDGTKTLSCEDGTTVVVSDGADGADGADGTNGTNGTNGVDGADGTNGATGPQGPPGTNGSSCTVVDNGDGTRTLSCDDGTSVTIANGTNGFDGSDGIDGTNGADGLNALVAVTAEPPGPNCATGGQKIEVGLDANRNGVLDPSEVDTAQTAYVCTPDIDECALDIDGCDQTCTNTDGGFVCSCGPGSLLDTDGKTCVRAEFLFWATTDGSIWRAELTGANPTEIVSGLSGTYALEVDSGTQQLFYHDDSTVYRANFDGTGVAALQTGLDGPFGLSVDSSTGKVYASLFGSDQLVRMNANGTSFEVIAGGVTGGVSGMDVDPVNGLVYTIMYDTQAFIESNTDGTSLRSVGLGVGFQGTDIVVDAPNGTLYFTMRDANVYACDLDGSNVRVFATLGISNQGLALRASTNTLYVGSSGSLYAIDIATGAVTNLGNVGGATWDVAVSR